MQPSTLPPMDKVRVIDAHVAMAMEQLKDVVRGALTLAAHDIYRYAQGELTKNEVEAAKYIEKAAVTVLCWDKEMLHRHIKTLCVVSPRNRKHNIIKATKVIKQRTKDVLIDFVCALISMGVHNQQDILQVRSVLTFLATCRVLLQLDCSLQSLLNEAVRVVKSHGWYDAAAKEKEDGGAVG